MRADRLVAITLLLQARGKMTTQALADELGVSRRTILRDIDALSLAGIPVYAGGGHGGGVALDENYRTTLTGLQEAEVRALFVAADNSPLLREVGLGEAAESTLRKLSAALPAPHQPSVDYIRQRLHIDPLWWWYDSETLPFWDDMQRAVYEDRRIRASYEHYDGTVAERVLEPFSLVAKSSTWYLVARRDGDLRTYRVSRFHSVVLLDEFFQRPPDFDLAAYWRSHLAEFTASLSEYRFTLRVHESRMVFAKWLAPGRCEVLATAGEWVTARFHFESMELAKMMVFGLGRDAEVIDPPELRAAVLEASRAVIDHHSA